MEQEWLRHCNPSRGRRMQARMCCRQRPAGKCHRLAHTPVPNATKGGGPCSCPGDTGSPSPAPPCLQGSANPNLAASLLPPQLHCPCSLFLCPCQTQGYFCARHPGFRSSGNPPAPPKAWGQRSRGSLAQGSHLGALHPKQPLAQAPPAALQTPAPNTPRDGGTNGGPAGWHTAPERSRTRNTSPKRNSHFSSATQANASEMMLERERSQGRPPAPPQRGQVTALSQRHRVAFSSLSQLGTSCFQGSAHLNARPPHFHRSSASTRGVVVGGGADFAIPSLQALGKRHIFTGAG